MIRSKKIAIASLLTVFIIGLIAGVFIERYVFDQKWKRGKFRDPGEFMFKSFSERLSLNEEQQAHLRSLLDDIKEKHRQIHLNNKQQYKAIQTEFDASFRKILKPDQLSEYEKMVAEFETKIKKDKKRRDERFKKQN